MEAPMEPPDPIPSMVDTTMKDATQVDDMVKSSPNSPTTISVVKQPVSFRDVVQSSSQWFNEARNISITSLQWEDDHVNPLDTTKVVSFPKETLDKRRHPWKLTLMGKSLGISIRPSFLTQRVRAMWKPKGTLEVIELGKDVFLFRFSMQDDYERALLGGPWFILDHYLMITKWKPNFRPSMNPFDRMTVWIRFPELPVEYYDRIALFEIAKKVGNPIRVDYATVHLTKARYARVCIDIDLSIPSVDSIWVRNGWKQIEYENINSLCIHCGRIGHPKESCTMFQAMKNKGTVTTQDDPSTSSTSITKPNPIIAQSLHPTPFIDNPHQQHYP
ncbi:uncharacterized protein LOC110726353 [Chenopodium quinoa]|uniref:uncharacterized protein LOC110726353 n=1 Tax=Chenopodium quinoa TaxID=63459 RepID=UPI000B7761FB|nr:uncharacterized protein LOC110726353 [Chenopodium quinoa]